AADEDQPGGRVAGWAVLRPGLQGTQAGVLERFFRRVEIAKVAQQRCDGLRPRRGDRVVDPGDIRHVDEPVGWKTAMGRISYEPESLARASSRAVSIACSRSRHSTR